MKRLFLLLVIVVFFFISLNALAHYSFLSSECNTFIEELKEKFREKEIVLELEKEYGFVWTVVLPKNDGVETEEIKEAIYNDETGKFEAIYNFTYITILNAEGWTKVIWGSASKFHPYDIPKLCFVYDG